MRRTASLTVMILASMAVSAQGLLDCIDPDVRNALLMANMGGRQVPVITLTVPAELATVKMSGEFTWVGSTERVIGRLDASTDLVQVNAAWRSSLPREAAWTAASAALANSGWQVMPRANVGPTVFDLGGNPLFLTACRDGQSISLRFNEMDDVTYALFIQQRGTNNNTSCNRTLSPSLMLGSGTGLDQYIPRFEMPVNPATGVRVPVAETTGGARGTTFNAQAVFVAKDSIGNIARLFAAQMKEQGWSSDASWNGTATAGSTWSRRVDAGSPVQATLSVTKFGEQQFKTMLRVTRLQ